MCGPITHSCFSVVLGVSSCWNVFRPQEIYEGGGRTLWAANSLPRVAKFFFGDSSSRYRSFAAKLFIPTASVNSGARHNGQHVPKLPRTWAYPNADMSNHYNNLPLFEKYINLSMTTYNWCSALFPNTSRFQKINKKLYSSINSVMWINIETWCFSDRLLSQQPGVDNAARAHENTVAY
jgi:hypothetical protein